MAHNLLQHDKMAYAGQVPWHGLGKFVGKENISAEEMIKAAGLDWEVKCFPLFAEAPKPYSDPGFLEKVPTDAFAVIRTDINRTLGVVGNRYTPIQNTSIFSFMDSIMEEGAAVWETAGSLFNGERVWALAKLPQGIMIPRRTGLEDVTNQYILLASGHTGKASCIAQFTPIRVVCWNTLSASLKYGEEKLENRVVIRHTPNAETALKEAHLLLGFTTKYYEKMGKMQNFLAGRPVKSILDLNSYYEKVFPDTEAENSRSSKERDKAMDLFSEEADRYGADWLSALNAATGLIDHKAVNHAKASRKLDSIWFGDGARQKEKAFDYALSFSDYSEEEEVGEVIYV